MLSIICATSRQFFDKFWRASRHITDDAMVSLDTARKQLLVDVSVIYRHDARTGIQRVVRALLSELERRPEDGYELRPVFAARNDRYRYARSSFLHDTPGQEADASRQPIVRVNRNDIFVGLDLAANILPYQVPQIRRWKLSGVKIHVIVYDLLPILQSQWFNRRTTKHFKRWLNFVLCYADGAICISEQVCSDVRAAIARHNYLQSPKVTKIRLSGQIQDSVPTTGLPDDAGYVLQLLRDRPTALMVGTIEPRKGYECALAAFEQIWARDINANLVIVGKSGWKTEAFQRQLTLHPELGKRLFWISDASDEFVECLYREATGVFVASYAEGYGLPLMEACNHGKPVLARDLSVFRELSHPAMAFFADDHPPALASQIEKWLVNAKLIDVTPCDLASWEDARNDLLAAIGIETISAVPMTKDGF